MLENIKYRPRFRLRMSDVRVQRMISASPHTRLVWLFLFSHARRARSGSDSDIATVPTVGDAHPRHLSTGAKMSRWNGRGGKWQSSIDVLGWEVQQLPICPENGKL